MTNSMRTLRFRRKFATQPSRCLRQFAPKGQECGLQRDKTSWNHGESSASLAPQYPARDGIKFLHKCLVACIRRRDQGRIERAVGTDRARFVFAWEFARQARNQARGLLGVGGK